MKIIKVGTRRFHLIAVSLLLVAGGIVAVVALAAGVPGTIGFERGTAREGEALAPIPAETGLGPVPFFNLVASGADFVKAGATTRVAGLGPSQTEPFVLVMPAPGGPVTATYISWNYLLNGVPPPTDTIVINGVPVTGNLVGTGTPDLCWLKEGAASYLVLDPGAVVAPGPNTIAGATDKPLGSDAAALGEGLTILSVFTATGAVRNVDLWAGYTSNTSEATGTGTASLTFSNVYPGGGAHFLLSGLDGQTTADDFFINGVLASGVVAGTGVAGDAWQGFLGPGAVDNLYDQANDVIAAPFLLAGAAGLTATTGPLVADCVGHSFAAIAFEAPLPECTVFPPAGLDNNLDTLAVVNVEILAFGLTDSVQLRGPTTIQRGPPFDPGDGRRMVSTEILSMDLTGTSAVLGTLRLVESSALASTGHIRAQNPGADFPADSFFDVFFEIETPLPPPFDRLHNEDPIQMRQVIRCIAPLGRIYVPAFRQQIPLFDALGNLVANITHAQHGISDPFCGDRIVDVHEDCDDGNLIDCDGCDSNCTTGCGNAIVCAPEQCDDGNNLPGDGCEPDCTETLPPECTVFPAAGSDDLDTLAVVNINVFPESVQLRGPTTIQRGNRFDPGDGRGVVETEIVAMDLTGASPLGPLTLVESPTLASMGEIKAQGAGSDFPADSFFNIFFEVETPLPPPSNRLHNVDPIEMRQVIRCIPPFGRIYVPAFRQEIPLFDELGNLVATLTHAQHGISDPFCGDGIVDPHEDCDDGNLTDCDGCDSNCTTGCGNAIVCAPEQCDDGNNLPADGCEPDCTVGPPLDHFTMYQAFGADGGLVRLRDQFQTQTVRLGPAEVFAVPADKNGEGIFDEIAHATCYDIPEGQFVAEVVVENQFGIQTLSVGNPVVLCVPTEKFPGPVAIDLKRDHYKCYEATGTTLQVPLVLKDQFQAQDIDVLQPIAFCTPVEKSPDSDGDGIVDHEDNCVDVANPSQFDADGDGFGNACDCDFDQNGTCGFSDFNIFLVCFGQTVPGVGPPNDPLCEESDQDENLTVGFNDFNLFLTGFGGPPGPCCTPPPAILNSVEHLTCYDTFPRAGSPVGSVPIRNQFFDITTLDVLDPTALCVPSQKLDVQFGCKDTYPLCGGICPPGEVCEPLAAAPGCQCVSQPPCDQSPFPECGGTCPPGEVCVSDPGQFCFCVLVP